MCRKAIPLCLMLSLLLLVSGCTWGVDFTEYNRAILAAEQLENKVEMLQEELYDVRHRYEKALDDIDALELIVEELQNEISSYALP